MAESAKGRLVAVAYPHDRFDHQIKGVDPVTREGVRVPASKLKQLQQLAEQHDVPLVVGEDEVDAQTQDEPQPGQAA